MILTDNQIHEAIRQGHVVIDPPPNDDQFSSTALDLHIGDDIRCFKKRVQTPRGTTLRISLDKVRIPHLSRHLEPLPREADGTVILRPGQLTIATTLERVELPRQGRLAARVEGRSRFARLGLVIHMTAPTIHNRFRGRITLEIMNHGPIELVLTPNQTRICQLVFERID